MGKYLKVYGPGKSGVGAGDGAGKLPAKERGWPKVECSCMWHVWLHVDCLHSVVWWPGGERCWLRGQRYG